MGFPWHRVAAIGLGIGGLFVPGLTSAINIVQENLGGLKGPDKKAAAIAIATTVVETAEGAAGKDLLNDPAVVAATSAFVDAYVALQNALAAAKAIKSQTPPQG